MMTRRLSGVYGLFLILGVVGCDFAINDGPAPTPISLPAPTSPARPEQEHIPADAVIVPLISVTDGDTIRVRFEGERERVRLIGIDTPETEHSPRGPQPFADEATAALTELLSGHTVRLQFDVEKRDRYGRLLAYVYADEVFVNERLASLGWARQLTVPPNVHHADLFAQAVQQAREARRGIWSH